NNELYKVDKKLNNEQVASFVEEFIVTNDDSVIYNNFKMELFIDEKKIASNLMAYEYIYDNLIYSTNKELVILEDLKDKKVIDDKIMNFSTAYYFDKNIFFNRLLFSEIAGMWTTSFGLPI